MGRDEVQDVQITHVSIGFGTQIVLFAQAIVAFVIALAITSPLWIVAGAVGLALIGACAGVR